MHRLNIKVDLPGEIRAIFMGVKKRAVSRILHCRSCPLWFYFSILFDDLEFVFEVFKESFFFFESVAGFFY